MLCSLGVVESHLVDQFRRSNEVVATNRRIFFDLEAAIAPQPIRHEGFPNTHLLWQLADEAFQKRVLLPCSRQLLVVLELNVLQLKLCAIANPHFVDVRLLLLVQQEKVCVNRGRTPTRQFPCNVVTQISVTCNTGHLQHRALLTYHVNVSSRSHQKLKAFALLAA